MLHLFTATIFLSAWLLFLVQPMVGKMILPTLGGTPAVWNSCLVFYQATLLTGYLYAHSLAKWLGIRKQVIVHAVVLLLPLAVLPISFAQASAPPTESDPTLWLLVQLLFGIGLPFFVVSTSAPLLQRWFASTAHPYAKDPYFLYAASNCGSLLALLGYPLIIEANLGLTHQAWLWTGAYVLLILVVLVCAGCVWRATAIKGLKADNDPVTMVSTSGDQNPPTLGNIMFWIFCAFVPSSLMLGVTAHITTNLASIPLLWVVPLALYLLTFILVFARRHLLPQAFMVRAMPIIVLALGPPCFFMSFRSLEWLLVPIHLLMFFVAAMVGHGSLAASRPSPRYLTKYYLWMSVGGVLGGLFNAIVAPLVFEQVIEYPMAMVLACLLLPRGAAHKKRKRSWWDVIMPLGLTALCTGLFIGVTTLGIQKPMLAFAILFAPPVLICFSFKERPLRLALGYAVVLVTIAYYADLQKGNTLHSERNFFGVKRVTLNPEADIYRLYHGDTLHGAQFSSPTRRDEPLTYYHRTGPLGDVFTTFIGVGQTPPVSIVGLGVGATASYAQPGQQFTFYEIDPGVARLAHDTQYFSFLADCRGRYDIVLGDGRLSMARAPEEHYGIIIIDAFSSDAIPVHLITREAIELYLSKLQDRGVLLFHVSNRYLRLDLLLGSLAEELGLSCMEKSELEVNRDNDATRGKTASHYVIMARRQDVLMKLADIPNWKKLLGQPDIPIWTDQYSSFLKILSW